MDSYAPCPCGSGKKVKFCCQSILPEMAKIQRLQDNNQPRMAIQAIDKLLKDHPHHAWLIDQRALALFNDERYEEARDSLVAFLRKSPDHPLSNALLALAMTELEPIENCKKVIHRAFLKSMTAEPRMTALLVSKLATHHLEGGRPMAARQHLALAARLEAEEERQQTLLAMLDLDSDTDLPYPLRGAHPLQQFELSAEQQQQAKKALRLAALGCFAEAADLLQQATQSDAGVPELWHAIGLLRAWDGNDAQAATALHQAARLYSDFELAVNLETIAQLCESNSPENRVNAKYYKYDVESLSRLLTRLDNEDRAARETLPNSARDGRAAMYQILDRARPADSDLDALTLESAPRSIAQLELFDRDEEGQPPLAVLSGLANDKLEQARTVFEQAAGELAKATEDTGLESDGSFPREETALAEPVYLPPQTPPRVRDQVRQAILDHVVDKAWMELPRAALGGKSPLEARGHEDLKLPLAAAVRVFDSYLDRRSVMLDENELRQRLDLPAPPMTKVAEDQDVHNLAASELQRLNVQELSDELFDRLMQRAMLIKHCSLSYRMLDEFLNRRSALVDKNPREAEQGCAAMAEICSRSLRHDEAIAWLRRGFELSKAGEGTFENQLMWKFRELTFRSRDPQDPELKDLLLDLWNQYGTKLPALRPRLEAFVEQLKIDAPWESAIATPQTVATGGGAVWSAETQSTTAGEKKLWLPD